MKSATTRIVILGGGFAGVYTARYLQRALRPAQRRDVEVVLVSEENYLVFQPMLPEVISGAMETLHVVSPIRRLAPKATLYTRAVQKIDLAAQTVELAPDVVPRPLTLAYDHLVLAVGNRLARRSVPGLDEHAIAFKYLGDALRLRNHVVHMLEQATTMDDPVERARLLTFVVAGGGFSGVECIAELRDFLFHAVRSYPGIRPAELQLVLLQSGPRILPEMSDGLADYAHRILARRGIEIALETRLKAVSAEAAIVQDKRGGAPRSIATRTVVATVPTEPHPLVTSLGLPNEKGRIRVAESLEVVDHPGIWALGDCAAVPQPDGQFSPPTAQHALRQAHTCAGNLAARLRDEPTRPFAFRGLGKLASLGRRTAVAEVLGCKISGLPAWLLWRAVYLSKFPGLDRKLRILSDWILDVILPRDITQVRIFAPDSVRREHFEPGELFFRQGDFGDRVYFLVSGEAEIEKNGAHIMTAKAGEVIGEVALVSHVSRQATVRAATAVEAVSVSRNSFEHLLAHLPGMRTTVEEIMRRHLGPAESRPDEPRIDPQE